MITFGDWVSTAITDFDKLSLSQAKERGVLLWNETYNLFIAYLLHGIIEKLASYF